MCHHLRDGSGAPISSPNRAQESPRKVIVGVQLIKRVPEAFKPSERPMSSTAHDQILPNKEEGSGSGGQELKTIQPIPRPLLGLERESTASKRVIVIFFDG